MFHAGFIGAIVVFALLWITRIVRVNITDKGLKSESHHDKSNNQSQPIVNEPYSDEKYYSIALKEIQVNKLSSGLWAKALAYSDGNQDKAKAYYLKERVKQLMQMHLEKLNKSTEAFTSIIELDKKSVSPPIKVFYALFITLVIILFVGTISSFIGGELGRVAGNAERAKHQDIESVLVKTADEVNKQLPITIDKHTRLDSTIPGPGLRFTYNNTILTISSQDINDSIRADLRQEQQSQLKKKLCSSPDSQFFYKNSVTTSHIYRSSDGSFIAQIDITPKDCGYAEVQAVQNIQQTTPSSTISDLWTFLGIAVMTAIVILYL
jgi:hypothetical protein